MAASDDWFGTLNRRNRSEILARLSAGQDVNMLNSIGENALFYATTPWGGDIELVQALVQAGIDVNQRNHRGESALQAGWAAISSGFEAGLMRRIAAVLDSAGYRAD